MTLSALAIFVPTFLAVSATPGLCMTLSLSLGMTIGLRRTLWMMAGELLGVALVAVLSVIGVAALMLQHPQAFALFKWIGGAYLAFLGIQLWSSRGRLAFNPESPAPPASSARALSIQGFITAVANPKGWAFFIALLPPFIDEHKALAPQVSLLVVLILVIEFLCLLFYAGGGQTLSRFLRDSGHVRLLNRIAGSLMIGVGVWLGLS